MISDPGAVASVIIKAPRPSADPDTSPPHRFPQRRQYRGRPTRNPCFGALAHITLWDPETSKSVNEGKSDE
jgi:hypothetical protein